MKNSLWIAVRVFVVTFLVLGVGYPLAVTGIAQLVMRDRANGDLIRDARGDVVGARLIGQAFGSDAYFHPRASASGYDALASGGSNLGPTSRRLAGRLAERARALPKGAVPADAITASGSGLDPDISPANAALQVDRVAEARGLDAAQVEALVRRTTAPRDLGFIGEPRVNVLALNLALDEAFGRPKGGR